MEYGLGRLAAPDARDMQYLLAAPRVLPTRTHRAWYDNGWFGDQGATSSCVGHAWSHFVEDSPRTHPVPGPHIDPFVIYNAARLLDEWEGTDYEGTSVRAGAKALQTLGVIGAYRWAFAADAIARNVLEVGPVVMGTEWTTSMFTPDKHGRVRPEGATVGGHAYVINGYNAKTKLFRAKNSWGRGFGINGHFWIHRNDVAALLARDGEACMAEEI